MITAGELYRQGARYIQKLGQNFWAVNIAVWLLYWQVNIYISSEHGFNWNSFRIFGLMAAVTGLTRLIYRRLNFRDMAMPRLAGIILLCSMTASALFYIISYSWWVLVDDWDFMPITFFRVNYRSVYYTGTVVVTWSVAYFVWRVRQSLQTETQQKERNIMLAQRAELQLLRYQLNPHFLFNSLNSIRALTLLDAEGARNMISELSEFLKYSIMTKNDLEVPLKQEMEALQHYLRIEKIRFKEKLLVEMEVEREVQDFPVPVLLLHPLVENAIKYGMETADLPLKVTLSARWQDNAFRLEVRNNGRWLYRHEKEELGIEGTTSGLRNVKDRLSNAYPDGHRFEIVKNSDSVSVVIEIFDQEKQHG